MAVWGGGNLQIFEPILNITDQYEHEIFSNLLLLVRSCTYTLILYKMHAARKFTF
jgi:hypothetical protein